MGGVTAAPVLAFSQVRSHGELRRTTEADKRDPSEADQQHCPCRCIDQFGAWGIVSGYSPPCSIISKRKPVPSICGSCGRFSASSLQVCEEASSCPHNQTQRASRGRSLRRAGDIGASPKFVAGRIVSLITTTVI
jgi:hypothetical protein